MEETVDNALAITKEGQSSLTPARALEMLKAGNQRFVQNREVNRDLLQQVGQTSTGQYPFAAVLGCIDSRVPAEIVFDQGIGDIFNVRIAGNFVNTDILGSLEFSCKVAGAKTIVVLGHKSCGAVKGACDHVELGNLTGMLSKIQPAVEAITDETEDRSSGNAGFVQKVSDMNVKMAVENILQQSDVLKGMVDNGEISVVGAMYDINTGEVEFRD